MSYAVPPPTGIQPLYPALPFRLQVFALRPGPGIAYPVVGSSIQAGFPSPADDYLDNRLSLDELLVSNQSATFFARVTGHSMDGASIHDGDILVIDRSLHPLEGDVVVASIDGEFTVKRYELRQGRPCLVPENPKFPVIELSEENDVRLWGVVTSIIHQTRKRR